MRPRGVRLCGTAIRKSCPQLLRETIDVFRSAPGAARLRVRGGASRSFVPRAAPAPGGARIAPPRGGPSPDDVLTCRPSWGPLAQLTEQQTLKRPTEWG